MISFMICWHIKVNLFKSIPYLLLLVIQTNILKAMSLKSFPTWNIYIVDWSEIRRCQRDMRATCVPANLTKFSDKVEKNSHLSETRCEKQGRRNALKLFIIN